MNIIYKHFLQIFEKSLVRVFIYLFIALTELKETTQE